MNFKDRDNKMIKDHERRSQETCYVTCANLLSVWDLDVSSMPSDYLIKHFVEIKCNYFQMRAFSKFKHYSCFIFMTVVNNYCS